MFIRGWTGLVGVQSSKRLMLMVEEEMKVILLERRGVERVTALSHSAPDTGADLGRIRCGAGIDAFGCSPLSGITILLPKG